jgi:adenylate cyclase
LHSVRLVQAGSSLAIPVDDRVAALIPFRGPGGPQGGSFAYISAADLLAGRLESGQLRDKIVLVGTTAPGLLDLRATPMGETYPGVETHASLLSALLNGERAARPDYALGYELVVLIGAGLLLAFALPLLSAARAVALTLGVVAAVVGLNTWLYLGHGLVLPLAAALVMVALAFALNMSHGYLVESRSKRQLAQLFGTYVPPELVDEMVKSPHRYTMAATTRELTVMFCDMRGFTQLSESMQPAQLQTLLNRVFSRLTQAIRRQRGTIDKYMGDCVMAFWGAPVPDNFHATRAVQTALDMAAELTELNREHERQGLPAIGMGVGLNTGPMCVGDMGSDVRRSYTVVGDAVNLGARLEGLSRVYGVDIVASQSTREQAPGFVWQELDRVRVKGKSQAVDIFTPLGPVDGLSADQRNELRLWEQALQAWRQQDWPTCNAHLTELQRLNGHKLLYSLFAQRVAAMQQMPPDPAWDGVTILDSK